MMFSCCGQRAVRVLIHRSAVTDLKYVPAKAEASQCISAREPSIQICRFDSVARLPDRTHDNDTGQA